MRASLRRIEGSKDYFVAGGKIPWWLGGISHHVSGHSGVVFVAVMPSPGDPRLLRLRYGVPTPTAISTDSPTKP